MSRQYRATSEVPPLVEQGLAQAARLQFEGSCRPEVGRLLRLLASQVRRGTIAEIGTGCGVGAAWLASALAPGASLVTIELDAERAAAAADLLSGIRGVRVVNADWRAILAYAPFALLFADVRAAKRDAPELLLQALQPGGLLVLDDYTPEDQWPEEWRGKPDAEREFWLNDPRVIATELLVAPGSAVILAARAWE